MFVQKIYFRYISMSSYEKHTGQKNNERFEPRNHVISKWDMIVRVSLVLLLTSSTDKDRNPVPGIWNPRRGLQNPRLSWIRFYGAKSFVIAVKSQSAVNSSRAQISCQGSRQEIWVLDYLQTTPASRFELRNHVISKWDMIVRVSLVLLLTSSTDKDRNPVPGIRNPRRGLQNPRLSWIPFYGAKSFVIAVKSQVSS